MTWVAVREGQKFDFFKENLELNVIFEMGLINCEITKFKVATVMMLARKTFYVLNESLKHFMSY
jgi:hypothetical protein